MGHEKIGLFLLRTLPPERILGCAAATSFGRHVFGNPLIVCQGLAAARGLGTLLTSPPTFFCSFTKQDTGSFEKYRDRPCGVGRIDLKSIGSHFVRQGLTAAPVAPCLGPSHAPPSLSLPRTVASARTHRAKGKKKWFGRIEKKFYSRKIRVGCMHEDALFG